MTGGGRGSGSKVGMLGRVDEVGEDDEVDEVVERAPDAA
jgi:hypothetical protein